MSDQPATPTVDVDTTEALDALCAEVFLPDWRQRLAQVMSRDEGPLDVRADIEWLMQTIGLSIEADPQVRVAMTQRGAFA